ncbi:MAG: LysR family transcriptional regulator [Alphaproteobacteria bacterium]
MQFTLKQVTYFLAVAEAGSLTGGAAQLGVSQSAVTESLQQLEARTGAALFSRHARGVDLTYQGHQFLRHAHAILASVADAERAISARPETVTGLLNLGVTSIVSGYFLAHVLARYRRLFPNVDVRVTEDERPYVEHLLVNGELDAGLVIVSNLKEAYALEHETLMRSRFRLWLPTEHPLCARPAVSLADLAGEPMVALAADEIAEQVRAHWATAGRSPRIVLRTSSVEAVRSLVATGAGLAILPDITYRPWSLEGDRIEARRLDEAMPPLDIGIAWRRGSAMPAPAARFIEMAREDAALRTR